MKIFTLFVCCLLILGACKESDDQEIYNENNTNVVNGVVFDIDEKPINGLYKIYYPNGNVKMEVLSKEGIPNGEGKFYNEDGVLEFKGIWVDGKLDGKFFNYFGDGSIHNELNYTKGLQNGIQRTFDEDGNVIVEVIFENGKAVRDRKSVV